jgi:hypothetical protein
MRTITQQERKAMAGARNNLAQMRAAMDRGAACDHCGERAITFSYDGGEQVWFHCADGYREHLAALRAARPSRDELMARVSRVVAHA